MHPISIRATAEEARIIDDLAQKEGRKRANMIMRLIREALAARKALHVEKKIYESQTGRR